MSLAMAISNPLGTKGFEFVEFSAPDQKGFEDLKKFFKQMDFTEVGYHRSKSASHFQQNDIHFILNGEPYSYASQCTKIHGPCTTAMAFRVENAGKAHRHAITRGAVNYDTPTGYMELKIPAVHGIGDTMLYFVDSYDKYSIYDVDFIPLAAEASELNAANSSTTNSETLLVIDHLTHNVKKGNMTQWAEFYEKIANFREIRYFDIKGKKTGLYSKALTSPCGNIRIPLNESSDNKSQIAEFLQIYNGEGIQHIALSTNDIYKTVRHLRETGIRFMQTPDTYYENIDQRIPEHGEDINMLQELNILIDGSQRQQEGILLQIFTEPAIGPVFFEIIQRKGNQGFGEGNFQALFDSIEADQIRRGVL